MTRPTIRVVIADDQPVIITGFRLMLEAEADVEVVGTATDGLAAVAITAQLRPDVVLMDIRMPGIDGIEATRRILDAGSADAVLMITTFDDDEYLRESARAGASGFLLKNAGPDLLAAAVRSAARGDALIDPAMTRVLLERSARLTPAESVSAEYLGRLTALTERERDVLTLVAQGLSNSEVGKRLFLSEATIKTHLANLYTKVGARSRVGAVMFAYESGFLKPHWVTG
ncbi:response regulator transcription factor [Parafrigoribacterium soli]|uniref:response regulator transcription factor n=1 Tax=Parafrigoribacterium soli TaxID=3144663 RepID=UPI0032EB4BB3